MIRDMDLCRDILLYFEKNEWEQENERTTLEDNYHILLLIEAGFLHGEANSSQASELPESFSWVRLTWSGHEFLDAARNPSVWEQARKIAGHPIPVGIMTQLLTSLLKKKLQLP